MDNFRKNKKEKKWNFKCKDTPERNGDSVALKQEIAVRSKLLKMVITKVNGKLSRFCGQFQAEIDNNAVISNITRFLYLKPMAVASACAFIELQSYTTAGYRE